MTTGYWVRGVTTNRTKVHLVDEYADGPARAICGFRPRQHAQWQMCGRGVHLSIVECEVCRRKDRTR